MVLAPEPMKIVHLKLAVWYRDRLSVPTVVVKTVSSNAFNLTNAIPISRSNAQVSQACVLGLG
jgi:hypothetical protein